MSYDAKKATHLSDFWDELPTDAGACFSDRKKWSDRFIDEQKGILSRARVPLGLMGSLDDATEEEDKTGAVDVWLRTKLNARIGLRTRTHGYFSVAQRDFTLRYPTEYDKIVVAGLGDFMLYCVADRAKSSIVWWTLYDLGAVRIWIAAGNTPDVVRCPHCCFCPIPRLREFVIDSCVLQKMA